MVQYVEACKQIRIEPEVQVRFTIDADGDAGIQVLDDEGDWVWVCYLGDDGKLYTCELHSPVTGLDTEDGFIALG